MDPRENPPRAFQTAMDLARQQSHAYQNATNNLAGTKRSWPGNLAENTKRATGSAQSTFTSGASLLRTNHSRLSPSTITDLGAGSEEHPSEYSQRICISATPSSTADPSLSLSHRIYGLPPSLIANFARLGIKSIYPWQKNCLLGPGLLSGEKNLIYSAPTGGGKSLVADGRLDTLSLTCK